MANWPTHRVRAQHRRARLRWETKTSRRQRQGTAPQAARDRREPPPIPDWLWDAVHQGIRRTHRP